MVGEYAGLQALRFGSNLVLWRLLSEETFGVMALVNVYLQAVEMFSDVGIGPSIVQSRRGGERAFLDTAWTVQCVRGLLLGLVACVAAYPLARFYEVPELVWYVPVAGLTSIFHGLDSTKIFEAQRNLDYARFTMMGLVTQAVTAIAMVCWAWVSPSVWALVGGTLLGVVLRTILSHVWLRGPRNTFRLERSAVRELIRFGRWMFVSTLLTFVAIHSDRLIFGKLVSLEELGVYSVAVIWALLPAAFVGQLIGRITFPLLAQAHQSGAPLGPAFRRARLPVILLSGFLCTCMLAGGPALIELLYPAKVADAGWILQFLTVGTWFAGLEAVNAVALMSIGEPKYLAIANGAKVIGMLVLIPVGYHVAGFAGAVAGFVAPDLAKYLVSLIPFRNRDVRLLGQDVAMTSVVAAVSAAGLALHHALSHHHPFVEGIAIFACCVAGWGIVIRVVWPQLRGLRGVHTERPVSAG